MVSVDVKHHVYLGQFELRVSYYANVSGQRSARDPGGQLPGVAGDGAAVHGVVASVAPSGRC